MQTIYFSEEHDMLREQLRRFVEAEIKPHGEAWEAAGMVPREVLRRMGELGFLGIRYPEKYGGSAMDVFGSVVLAEELGRSTFSGVTATVTVHTDMASPHLFNAGSEAQIERYLPAIIKGETITAIAVTEAGGGSDVAGLRTRARRDGEDWVLDGTKMFITNGVHADLYLIAARSDPGSKGSRGISMFLVEKGTPGFSVGRQLEKTGWHCSDTAELVLEDCRVPGENLLGEENRGFYAVMKNFQIERLMIGATAMSEATTALELTIDYVRERKAFGGRLIDQQVIRQRLASLQSRVEAGRQLTYHAAWLHAQGLDCVKEMSMVKALCGELVNEVTYACVQFHGAMGYMRESTIERMARDSRVYPIGGGATEVMLEEVAKRWQGGRNW
ncbi:MAG: acyl-CoA dehydrogenase family protein [Alphaproteobacteria bacterium]